jgi:hypothetical protein
MLASSQILRALLVVCGRLFPAIQLSCMHSTTCNAQSTVLDQRCPARQPTEDCL